MPLLDRTGWTATASSNYAGRTPAHALDGSTSTFYLSDLSNGVNVNFPHWLAVDMQSSQVIDFVKYKAATPYLTSPIWFGQNVPCLNRLYVSDLESPDPEDDGDWTLAGEQYWPEDNRTHYIYSVDTYGNRLPRTCRHFKLLGVHDTRLPLSSSYHRMACEEIYAGLMAPGDAYKVYWKAHPRQFHIFPDDLLEGELRSGAGIVDTLELQTSLTAPANLQLATTVCQTRLWHTAPLRRYYPEAMFWDWDVPPHFPDSSNPTSQDLPIESVNRMVEGSVVNASTLGQFTSFDLTSEPVTICGSVFGSWPPNEFGMYSAWGINGEWVNGVFQKVWDVLNPEEAVDSFLNVAPYSHIHPWGSTSQNAPDHEVDVARLNATDIFYLIVWGTVYPDKGLPHFGASIPTARRTNSSTQGVPFFG